MYTLVIYPYLLFPHQQSSCFVIAVEFSRDNKNYETTKIRLIKDLL